MTALRAGAATDTGLVRKSNQDSLLALTTVFAVADGMGGHAGGEVASRVAVEVLRETLGDPHGPLANSEVLLAAIQQANRTIFDRSATDPDLRGMGTTVTVAALVWSDGEERVAVANVGDSRTYVLSANELTQLTLDHSVPEELVREGQLDPSEVDTHPQRHILTRALGVLPEIDIDLWELLPWAGDRLLLCSDGLVREVSDDQIAAVLRRLADPAEAAQELVARARASGGSDNITVVIVDVIDDDDRALVASRALQGAHEDDGSPHAGPSAAPVGPAGGPAGTGAPETVTARLDPGRAATGVTVPGAVGRPAFAGLPPPPRRRRVTWRVALFVTVILLVLAGAAGAVVLAARGSYFVTFGASGSGSLTAGSPLADPGARPLIIEQGRPGGLLWFQPTLAERTQVLSSQVLPAHFADLLKGKEVGSLSEARAYVQSLRDEAARAGERTTEPTPSSVPANGPTTTTQSGP